MPLPLFAVRKKSDGSFPARKCCNSEEVRRMAD